VYARDIEIRQSHGNVLHFNLLRAKVPVVIVVVTSVLKFPRSLNIISYGSAAHEKSSRFSRRAWPERAISWQTRSILPDRSGARARPWGSNLSRGRSKSRPCVPRSSYYILITYLSGRQDREESVEAAEEDRSRRTARPFCLWERITHGEKVKEDQVE